MVTGIVSAETPWDTGNVNIVLGQKSLNRNDWKPVGHQFEVGFEGDYRQINWPVNIVVGFTQSRDTGTATIHGKVDVTGSTMEYLIGIKKIWDNSQDIHPFISGGASMITAKFAVMHLGKTESDNDTVPGYWIGTGAYWTVSKTVNIGAEIKYSSARVTLFGERGDAGGAHYGVIMGYHY